MRSGQYPVAREQLWPAIHNGAELGLTGPGAFARASQPPDQIKESDRWAPDLDATD
jgi:hypothetical protein